MVATFGEKRRLLRRFRQVADRLRNEVNGVRFVLPKSLSVSREDYEALEFGLSHLKVWVPELDDEMEVIPGKGRLMRQNFLFRLSTEPRQHLMFKYIPVFPKESV